MDTLQRFMFERSPVRGELVEISDAWQQVQSQRSYPQAVSTVLGEMMAAAALLSAENGDQVTAFLTRHPGWTATLTRSFTPLQGGDGFFLSLLQAPQA